MEAKELLEKLVEAIKDSSNTVTICTPSGDYYARADEWDRESLTIISADRLIDNITDLINDLS